MKDTTFAAEFTMQCSVLVVDDDRATAEEVVEAVKLLGYACSYVLNAASALQVIADDRSVGVILTDVQMPGMSGISLLDELASRFAQSRPLVTLVLTGIGNLDVAVAAMRNEASDFLTKPVTQGDLAEVLRRAMRKWLRLVGERSISLLGATPRNAPDAAGHASPDAPPLQMGDAELLKVVRKLVRMRDRRDEFLNHELFSDPTWDMLLDLTSARLEAKSAPVSSVCQAARVPMSTALRQIRNMVDMGLVRRWPDPSDRRRDLLEINDEVMDAMRQYLTYVRAQLGV